MPDNLDGGVGSSAMEISAGQRMLSAVTGSLLTSLLVTPLDVVRVRLQSQAPTPPTPSGSWPGSHVASFSKLPANLGISACCREVFWVSNKAEFCLAPSRSAFSTGPTPASAAVAGCAAEEVQRRTFTSTLDGLRKIARHEGLTTLWRGLSPTLAMAIPANVIYFTGYDWLRSNAQSPVAQRVPDGYAPLVAGALARTSAATAISPIEMFRTRLQATASTGGAHGAGSRSLSMEVFRGLREMAQLQGYSSLWRGLSLTLWRDVPFSGLYWWGYETTVGLLKAARASAAPESHATTLMDSFGAGALSGALAAFVTTPFDVGKTRRQVRQHSGHPSTANPPATAGSRSQRASSRLPSPPPPPEEGSMPRFLTHIFRTEGLAGLWTGGAARCLKVAPACAIMISSYEIGKKMAAGMNERQNE
ncbi:MAG: hypothetical protein M1826_007558 [Phylliscum demangeonii]|nr:MAG: hypothetical protein M1826_007558 [Phylliscum demangeonii]